MKIVLYLATFLGIEAVEDLGNIVRMQIHHAPDSRRQTLRRFARSILRLLVASSINQVNEISSLFIKMIGRDAFGFFAQIVAPLIPVLTAATSQMLRFEGLTSVAGELAIYVASDAKHH